MTTWRIRRNRLMTCAQDHNHTVVETLLRELLHRRFVLVRPKTGQVVGARHHDRRFTCRSPCPFIPSSRSEMLPNSRPYLDKASKSL